MEMRLIMLSGFLALIALSSCFYNPKSGRGFQLPDGNAEMGKLAFMALKCYTCHKVDGVEQLPPPMQFNLTLGGETTRVKTYGELVTAIINPSHVVSKKYLTELGIGKGSPMPKYNREMTVEQLIDLVAFLHPRYRLVVPEYKPPYPL